MVGHGTAHHKARRARNGAVFEGRVPSVHKLASVLVQVAWEHFPPILYLPFDRTGVWDTASTGSALGFVLEGMPTNHPPRRAKLCLTSSSVRCFHMVFRPDCHTSASILPDRSTQVSYVSPLLRSDGLFSVGYSTESKFQVRFSVARWGTGKKSLHHEIRRL